MQVFVTGATGYIGFAVSAALRRAGYRVWGLARSETKARRLALLVHTGFDYSANGVAKDRTAIDTLLEAGRRGAKPKTFIFTSGAWVYGDTSDRMADETTPPNPPKLVAWRPAHEQMVLQAAGVRGLVIRPGDVYGGSGGLTGQWFAGPSTGNPPLVVGDGRNRTPMVHVDDLADAYVRGAAGYEGEVRPTPLVEARKTLGDFADALALSQHIDARKAVRLLGWYPSHEGFLDEADVYYRAWKAYRVPC